MSNLSDFFALRKPYSGSNTKIRTVKLDKGFPLAKSVSHTGTAFNKVVFTSLYSDFISKTHSDKNKHVSVKKK